MYLLSEQRLSSWLNAAMGQEVRVLNREILPSFQQYAERIDIESAGQARTCVMRLYMARFNLWPPFDLDLGALVATALNGLKAQGVPCAAVLADSAYLPGAQGLLLQWLPGRALRYPLAPADIDGLAQTLARLHAARPPQDLPRYPLDRLLRQLRAQALVLQLTDAVQILDTLAPLLGEEQPVWLHGDAHAGNFLRSESGDIYPVDWDETGVADFRIDLAYTWMLFARRQDQAAADRFLEVYRKASGRSTQALHAWWRLINARDYIAVEYLRAQRQADDQRSDLHNWLSFGASSYEAMMENDDSGDSS